MNRSNSLLASLASKLAQHSKLAPSDVDAVLDLPHVLGEIEPGDYLVRDGDRVDRCTVLLRGYAYRSKVTGTGARQICCFHVRGDWVDLQNSVLGRADHSVQALTQVAVAYIPVRDIHKMCEGFPGVAQALWRDTLIDASIFREWILNVGQRDAVQRISHLLCEFALRQHAAGISQGPEFEFPLTQEQLGDATGLTSVHVNRTLQRMRNDGLIAWSKRIITVTDWEGLQKRGDFSRHYLHLPASVAA